MIGLIDSFDVEYNGTENEALFKLVCDSAAELISLTHYDNIKIRIGSECTDIATGDKYLKSSSGWVLQPSANVWENVYTKAQVDSMYSTLYQTMLYYHTTQTSTDSTITFYAFAGFVGSLTIYGNGSQNGAPTPDNPVMPDFCGTLDGTDWKIPITCAGQTTPVYLGTAQTVRKIRKLVLDGTETLASGSVIGQIRTPITGAINALGYCTHYILKTSYGGALPYIRIVNNVLWFELSPDGYETKEEALAAFKAYLAAQYAAGTPVTVWYVLAEPTTGIVNEQLAKIGDYADELSLTSAIVSIPTADGENTLTVDTDLAPSKIEISGGEVRNYE